MNTTQAEEQARAELLKTQAKLTDLRLLLQAYLKMPSSDGRVERQKLRAALKGALLE